jgi:hypothetical protein
LFSRTLLDCLQHVARFRYLRPVDFRLCVCDLLPGRSAGFARSAAAQAHAHTLGFVEFERTRVRFLLRDADFFQHIKNLLALYLKLTCQIVYTNFTHPPLLLSLLLRT